ncbi:MAG: PLP-dependent aminotransferase family protein [Acidobacteriaceae bacterium]|nr:PLP-dependent aminotransferase family protein [Acidobacteriaceae bacterium]
MADLSQLTLDSASAVPLYRQLADSVTRLIAQGVIQSGEKLPATRELASQLGLNRTTIAAAYSSLEDAGLIRGHVGRGSFVAENVSRLRAAAAKHAVATIPAPSRPLPGIDISFANSRPSSDAFPLEQFRRIAKEVIEGPEAAEILQLGPTHGYAPLRRLLLNDALEADVARAGDDLIMTNGCQQALDLLARVFASGDSTVAIEDPVYHGLIRVFARSRAELLPIPIDEGGLDVNALEEALEGHHPRLLMVTPSFQNPTGATLSFERRKRIVSLAQRHGTVLVENDIYTELRYRGQPLPTLKSLDESGNTILLRSFSKVLFPGLRVGWAIAPRAIVTQLADAKQTSDLHSDQLSQAVLLRFTESGESHRHLENTKLEGQKRLAAVFAACRQFLPQGATFTSPEGGMNLWIELPAPLTADLLLTRTQERGVDFLPGRYFSVRGAHARGFRISFGGLPPDQISRGIQILGDCARRELASSVGSAAYESAAVLV